MKVGDSIQKRCPNCNGIICGTVAVDENKTTEANNALAFRAWQNAKDNPDRKWQGMDNRTIHWEAHKCPTLPRHPMERGN